MRFLVYAFALLFLASCTKEEETPVPPAINPVYKSTFSLAFDDKSYSDTATSAYYMRTKSEVSPGVYYTEVTLSSKNLDIVFYAVKSTVTTTSTISPEYIDEIYFIDKKDGKKYENDVNSKIIITRENASWAEGTIDMVLHRNGLNYPCKGTFKIKR